MNTADKIQYIADWTASNYREDVNKINYASGEADFARIEELLGEKLPSVFTEIYTSLNGEVGNESGVLCGHEFLSTRKIITNLEFSRGLLKPQERRIIDPNASNKILDEIADLFFKSIPNKKKFGILPKKWRNAVFSCAQDTYSQISVEYDKGDSENYSLKEAYSNRIFDLGEEIHQLEKEAYNWDKLQFTMTPDGRYSVEREDYDWGEENFSSCPESTIKKEYYHYKWLPVFHDFGGNFIGIDLDPDQRGVKGQVIFYGSDEKKMVVIANSFEAFLDFMIREIGNNPNEFSSEHHLHDVFRKIRNCD